MIQLLIGINNILLIKCYIISKQLIINKVGKSEINKYMDEKGRPEGFPTIGNISKPYAGDNATYSLHFRLTQMKQNKRNHLD